MSTTNIAGESSSFNCIVSKNVHGLMDSPQVVWVDNGTEITEKSMSSATLIFNKLNTSHGKVYTCQGSLSSPVLSKPLIVMKNYSVIVKSKP